MSNFVVGITGGIGSGKTTICKIFTSLGIPVYYADEEAKLLNNTDLTIKNALIALYGKELYSTNGLDRQKLASIIFSDKFELQKVNQIIHPVVALHFINWKNRQTGPFVLKEAAILFESGSYKQVDRIISVSAHEKERIKRVMLRNNFTEEEVRRRMSKQLSDEERNERSDFVISNNEKDRVLPKVLQIYERLLCNGSAIFCNSL